MSDKPQGPGWWLASDGTWHPPELHPSVQAEPVDVSGTTYAPDVAAARAMHPSAVPEMTDVPEMAYAPDVAAARAMHPSAVPELPQKRTWSGESDRRPEAGPMYPDLFERAVAGTHLADVVTVQFADGESRSSLDVASFTGRPGDDRELVSTSARTPAEVGAFTGATAKRRWRLHR